VRVADIRREEFEEAKRGAFAGCRDECRHDMCRNVTDDLGSIDDGGELLGR
jgi:hypothetical protein